MESRISELEIKLSHCEHDIDELNRTIFRQQQQMDLLQGQMRELYRMMLANESSDAPGPHDEIPPHY